MTTLLASPSTARRWSASPAGPLRAESVVELSLGTVHLVTLAWGRFDGFGTAAYWVAQARDGAYAQAESFGSSLAQEVCFCLLGGYGVTAEMNSAAYAAVLDADLIRTDPAPDASEIESVLRRPLSARGHRGLVRYRFPGQRGMRVASALRLLANGPMPSEPVELRDALLSFTGIGPKTASW
ncbi:MAG TPA: hypothetical protein VNT52_10425, partial [Acidimicrobiales bacterium]|nr:hypothetical protein [Acidimicrobiales bacterium]